MKLKTNKKSSLVMFKNSLNRSSSIDKFNRLIIVAYIFYILYIIFLSGIIYYINSIKDCKCFMELNKTGNVNINYIYILEIIFLVLIIFGLISLMLLHYTLNKVQKGGNTIYVNIFILIIMLIVQGYLIYNIYKLSQIPDNECECMNSWLKNLLYIQCVLIIIGIISSIYMFIQK